MTSSRLSSASHSVVVYPRLDLLHPTSRIVSTCRYVAVFTCANDYSDLRGEMLVHQLLGSNVVLAPSKNPFKAATIVHQPASELQRSNKKGKKGRGAKGGAGNDSGRQPEWSCSSCYVYAVQGSDPDAAALPAPESAARGELGGKLRKLAERLRETETPSPSDK